MRTDHHEMPARGAGVNPNGRAPNGRRTITAQHIAKARDYLKGERAFDAARWRRGELDVIEPTIKLAAATFVVTEASVSEACRILEARARRNKGHHPGYHHDGVHHLHGDDHLGDPHRHSSGNGAAVPAPTGLTLELVDTLEGRQEFLKQVQLLFKALDAVRSQAERTLPSEPELPGLVAAE
jgi:hypothetical protein